MPFPEDPNIPILGQAGTVLSWWPTTLVHCKCDPKRLTLIVVSGFGNPSICPKCQVLYQADSLVLEGGVYMMTVGVVLPPNDKGTIQ